MDVVICCLDPPYGGLIVSASGNATKKQCSAVSHFRELTLAEEACVVQGHASFLRKPMSNDLVNRKTKTWPLTTIKDNSDGSSQLKSSSWGWLKPCCDCPAAQFLPRPCPVSVPFLHRCWFWLYPRINILLSNLSQSLPAGSPTCSKYLEERDYREMTYHI